MAAAPRLPLRLLLLLLLLLLAPPATPRTPGPSGRGRRFSELKVCADVECSMLMYRGEALEDFEGPDCRFVNFRKGDTVYVYYKLAGISPEVWAGSVGQAFGYFPKDLIHVAYEYTKEELQVPADETDFVCFSGGKDDFTNYSLEELLAHLELPSPAPGDLEEVTAKASQHVEPPAEVSEDQGPRPTTDSSSEASSTGTPGSAQVPKDGGETLRSPPQADAPMEHGQGAPPSSKPLEDTGASELQAPKGQSNRTSNSSQGPGEQLEKMDAYKRLKQEMTLDLQTRFGSTADALVSDDETTGLVTSLEDEQDEDLEAEYYMAGQEEEEEEDGVEGLPLLTFGHGDQGTDRLSPGRTGVEGGTAGWEPNSSGKSGEQVPPAPGGTAHGGQRQRNEADSGAAQQESTAGQRAEHSSAVDTDDPPASGSRGADPSVLELTGATGTAGAFGIRGVLQASKAKASSMDMDIHVPGKVASEKDPVPGETEAENAQPQEHGASPPGTAWGTQRQSEPTARQGKDAIPSATASQDRDPWRAAVHISKEESGGEPNLAGDPKEDQPLSGLKDEGSEREAQASALVLGENRQQDTVSRAEKDSVPDTPRPPHVLTTEPLKQGLEESQLPAHNPQPSSLSESGLKEGAPDQGENDSGQLDSEEEQVGEGKEVLLEQAPEDFLEEEPVSNSTGQTVGGEAPVSHPEDSEAEAEADDYTPEEQLEDENALSARQARAPGAPSTETQDRLLGAGPQNPGGMAPGALRNVLETKEHREETGRKSEMEGPGVDATGGTQGASGVAKEAGTLAGRRAQTPSMRWDVPGMENHPRVPEAAAAPQIGSEPGEGEHPGENPKVSGELSDLGGLEAAQIPGSEPHGGDLAYWPPQHLPIIGSFFKDQQSWLRFQKFMEVPELEALLQDLSARLRAAQRESLPYNAEKVLDKVFRAAESHILSVAEQMLDARASDSRDSEVFEEAAVLDDVQDLIYFVRYQHSTAELPAFPATLPPPGLATEGPTEELQPPTEEDFSQEKVEDFLVLEPGPIPGEPIPNPGELSPIPGEPNLIPGEPNLIPGEPNLIPGELSSIPREPSLIPGEPSSIPGEPSPNPGERSPIPGEPSLVPGESSPVDPPESSTTVATELFPEPGPEEDTVAGMLVPESFPVEAHEVDKQLEKDVEEPARATPLDSVARLIFSCVACLTRMLVATLPEGVQPGPDFYGLPWQPVLATAFWGIISLVFLWRTVLEVKAKKYQVTEQQISEKIENLRKENSKLVQELSSYEQKVKESKELAQENKKLSAILSEESVKYEDKIKKLEENNKALNGTARSLQDLLETERAQNAKNQDLILENKKSIKKLKDVISMNASELSEVQIALNEAKLSEEKVKSECHWVQEENAKLKKMKSQLQQEVKEWTKSHSELSEQIEAFKWIQKDLEKTLNHKDDNIGAMTNCITQLNLLDCESQPENQNRGGNDLDELANGEVAGDQPEKLKNRIKQMMDVSRTQTAVAVVEEDLNILQSKLRGSLSIKSNLEDEVKKLKEDRDSLLSVKSELEEECKTLKQKVEILNELYQEKEMMLQKKLSQEEYGRQEREQLLLAADEKANLAAEEVKTYKQRIEEMEDELMKTERSFKNQIAVHEKKAHDNWLKARAAERAMVEEKRESATLRHKLLEMTQKMSLLQKEPVIVKPLPGRPSVHNPPRRGPVSQNGCFGPSPVSGGECSPPLSSMAEPPARSQSATMLSHRDAPRSEFDAESGASPMMNDSSRNSSPSRALDENKVTVAVKGPPLFPGMPPRGPPMAGPPPPPGRYGPPPPLTRPFGSRPIPPPFGSGLRPPLGPREYAPGVPPGKLDGPYGPREFIPGHAPFRPLGPLGPREYVVPGTRLPHPPHGPQDYLPASYGPQDYPPLPRGPQDYPSPSAARDFPPSGSRDEASYASQGGSPSSSEALI